MEAALAALAAFDAQADEEVIGSRGRRERRDALVAAADEVLWSFIVQREACGLRDSARAMRDYGVPPEVQVRMGLLPAAPPGKRRHSSPSPISGRAGVGTAGTASAKSKTPP